MNETLYPCKPFSSLSNDKILDQSQLTALGDNKIIATQKFKLALGTVENTV